MLLFLKYSATPVVFLLARLHQQFQQLLADQDAAAVRVHGVFDATPARVYQGVGVG